MSHGGSKTAFGVVGSWFEAAQNLSSSKTAATRGTAVAQLLRLLGFRRCFVSPCNLSVLNPAGWTGASSIGAVLSWRPRFASCCRLCLTRPQLSSRRRAQPHQPAQQRQAVLTVRMGAAAMAAQPWLCCSAS